MGDEIEIEVGGAAYRTRTTAKHRRRKRYVPRDPRQVTAFVPGTITEVLAEPGREVARGDGLFVLEAMKMRNLVTAPLAGTVVAVRVAPGALVAKGDVLVELAPVAPR